MAHHTKRTGRTTIVCLLKIAKVESETESEYEMIGLLDVSASMGYGSDDLEKLEYGCFLAASSSRSRRALSSAARAAARRMKL